MAIDPKRVKEIFLEAADLSDEAARSAYLDKACGGDAGLRERVEALLRSHDPAGSFLGTPAAMVPDPNPDGTMAHDVTDPDGGSPSPDAGDASDTLQFLTPPGRPDSLGRLGHYEVLEVLGKGGFGIVLRAFDEKLQRVVAIKVLSAQVAATSPARKRFLREARSSAKVRHENIVQVYAVEEQPLPYLVMEFIPGETLQQRIDRTGPLETPEVLQIGRQIAEGLAAAHAQGLIHRDIKPGNILIEAGPNQHVKITDFGLARAADDASLTQSGLVAGTPMFMAPEQANGDMLDHRADLFSLGSVLYTMVSGRPPFRANSTLAVLKRVAEDTPRPIPEIIPEVPPWLCDLIARLHAKKPDDRIGTAKEMANLLGRGLEALQRAPQVPSLPAAAPVAVTEAPREERAPAGTVEPPKPAPAVRPRFHSRRWAAAAAVMLLALLGGFGFTEATGVTNVHGTVIRLFSPEGTLVVEVDDPGVSIQIDGSDMVITGAGAKEIRLKPGSYMVEGRKDGKVVSRELVTVTKDGRQVVKVRQEAVVKGPDPKTAKETTDATAWERSVAAMPANEQVKAVSARLKELNPGFDGKVMPVIENGVVTGLEFLTIEVDNIAPVRALKGLTFLNCHGWPEMGKLSDLSPLKGMSLNRLHCSCTQVADLTALSGMPLKEFMCGFTPVSDLGPLKGMPLVSLACASTRVSDLAPLKGMKLQALMATSIPTTDLTPLRGMPLKTLDLCSTSGVTNLQPLQGMPLEGLNLMELPVSDLSALKGMASLQLLYLDATKVSDAGLVPLKDCKNLTTLTLGGTQVSDAGLAHLKDCKQLTQLTLGQTKVTAKGVEGLAKALTRCKITWDGGVIEPTASLDPDRRAAEYVLSLGGRVKINEQDQETRAAAALPTGAFRLTYVYLDSDNTKVTDVVLATLRDCKNLTFIHLYGCWQITDAGMAQLKDCKQLMGLDVYGSQVTDAGLVYLKDLKNLTHFRLGQTGVTDAGLALLKDFKNLTNLDLSHTPVTDMGIAHFKGCENMKDLYLVGCKQLSDAGLAQFKTWKNLTRINVRTTKVTAATIDELKKSLPKCKIEWDGGVVEPK